MDAANSISLNYIDESVEVLAKRRINQILAVLEVTPENFDEAQQVIRQALVTVEQAL